MAQRDLATMLANATAPAPRHQQDGALEFQPWEPQPTVEMQAAPGQRSYEDLYQHNRGDALRAALMLGSNTAAYQDALGAMPDLSAGAHPGAMRPSLLQNIQLGNYGAAGMQGVSLVSPFAGKIAGALRGLR